MAQAVFDLCVFDEVAFDESVVVPTAITQAATNIGNTTARINGKISDDGGASCEARFRWRKAEAKYEYCSSGTYAGATVYGDSWRAQSFTPQITHNITSVKLYLRKSSSGASPGDLTVSIKATDGEGKPTGEDLCVGTTNGNTLPSPGYEWREITFSSSATLTASTKYAIVCRALDGDSGNIIYWACVFEDPPYLGGCYMYSNNGGSSWTIGLDEDCYFEEWGVPAWTTTEWQNTLETNDTYYEDLTELDPATEYEFQTQAKNSAGEGVWSASAYFETTVTLVITPSPVQAIASVIAPTVKLGSTTATPEHIDSLAQVVQPNVKQGNIIFSPAVIDAIAEAVNPSVIYGAIIPDPISAIGGRVNPVVVLSSISITPTYIEAIGQVVAPIVGVDGTIYITPDAIDAIGGRVNPTVILGAISLTPDALSAIAQVALGNVKQGNIIYSPAFIKALGKVVAPTVIYGSITLEPESIQAIARGENPEVILASMTVTPEFVKALAGVIAPTVLQTWIGRKLRLVIITSQYRKVNVVTGQKRKVIPITTQKRKVNVITGE